MSALCLEPGRRCRLSAPPEDVCDFRKPYVRRLGRARYLLRGPRRARPGDREATHMTLSTTRASDCLGARLKSTRSLAVCSTQRRARFVNIELLLEKSHRERRRNDQIPQVPPTPPRRDVPPAPLRTTLNAHPPSSEEDKGCGTGRGQQCQRGDAAAGLEIGRRNVSDPRHRLPRIWALVD